MLLAALLSVSAVAAPVALDDVRNSLDLKTMLAAQAKIHLTNLAGQRQAFHDGHARAELATVGQPAPNKKMHGTFVTSCEDFVAYENGMKSQPVPCSSLAAERIEDDGTVVTDLTIYVKDNLCRPNASDVLAKIVLYSTITYGGMSNSPQNRGGKLITYTPTHGQYTFNYQGPYGEIIEELNKFCPCHNATDHAQWQTDHTRNLTVADCAGGPGDPNAGRPGPSDLCNLVVGHPMYQTFKWIDYNHYIQSEGAFNQAEGWAMPMNRSIVNTLLDESGDTNPATCNYLQWPSCEKGVTDIATVCDTCSTLLECEACIYYEFPSDIGKTYEWNYCCPCLYYYADAHTLPWMKVHC